MFQSDTFNLIKTQLLYQTQFLHLPVIDLTKLLSHDTTELQNIDRACREWGFFEVHIFYPPHLL